MFINVFGIIIDSIISLTCVFADFISGVLVAPHETAWGNLGEEEDVAIVYKN